MAPLHGAKGCRAAVRLYERITHVFGREAHGSLQCVMCMAIRGDVSITWTHPKRAPSTIAHAPVLVFRSTLLRIHSSAVSVVQRFHLEALRDFAMPLQRRTPSPATALCIPLTDPPSPDQSHAPALFPPARSLVLAGRLPGPLEPVASFVLVNRSRGNFRTQEIEKTFPLHRHEPRDPVTSSNPLWVLLSRVTGSAQPFASFVLVTRHRGVAHPQEGTP